MRSMSPIMVWDFPCPVVPWADLSSASTVEELPSWCNLWLSPVTDCTSTEKTKYVKTYTIRVFKDHFSPKKGASYKVAPRPRCRLPCPGADSPTQVQSPLITKRLKTADQKLLPCLYYALLSPLSKQSCKQQAVFSHFILDTTLNCFRES